ncbi:MAG: UDP-4-amino-4,6-dideoxy-N-acetyl-beta-L-altrosamine transaminase [Leptospiraceae bacterium]|nr:UDP-4-amino-4,6-dideoxy-N-acetyl-beta-L-altrosamine transaminase [Leptospiraceae bacterium]
MIPYGKQSIREEDIEAVVEVLRSDFLTQGPAVPAFERAMCEYCGAGFGVAVSSATAALHLAYLALGLRPGLELWTSPITFVATANAALYCGARVDFVDVESDSGLMSVDALEAKLNAHRNEGKPLPHIVAPVHLAGLSCDMIGIHRLAQEFGFRVVEDASHAIGATFQDHRVGSCTYSDISVFSFHPVKIMTTGEGGMALTNSAELADSMSLLRSHGITRQSDQMLFPSEGGWYYEQIELGFNYRMTDIQAALGLSQLSRVNNYVARRNELAKRFDSALANLSIGLPVRFSGRRSAFHLYSIRLQDAASRSELFHYLRQNGIGVQVHYIPVVHQPYYRDLGFRPEEFPQSMKYYHSTISLPLFPDLLEGEQDKVSDLVKVGLGLAGSSNI